MGKKEKKHAQDKGIEMEPSECCCHSEESECGCDDDCCCGSEEFTQPHLARQFFSKAEKIIMLEEYMADLKAELIAVEEEIAELKK